MKHTYLFYILLLLVASCNIFDTNYTVDTYEFAEASYTATTGEVINLFLNVEPTETKKQIQYNWTCNSSDGVTLEGTNYIGLFKANKAGSYVVSVASPDIENASAQCVIKVTGETLDDTGITANLDDFTTYLGQDVPLVANLQNGSSSADEYLSWKVGDTKVGAIIGTGSVVAFHPLTIGSTTITITHPMLDTQKVIYVTVNDTQDIYISPEASVFYVEKNYSLTISASVIGIADSKQSLLSWKSNDTELLTITGSGSSVSINANDYGTASITLSYTGCNDVDIIVVITDDNDGVSSDDYCYIRPTKTYYTSSLNSVLQLTASLQTSGSFSSEDIDWTTEDNVTLLTSSGGSILCIPKEEGLLEITLHHPDAIKTASIFIDCSSEYEADEEPALYAETKSFTMGNGITKTLSVTYLNATQTQKNSITWTSSNTNVLTVYGSGESVLITSVAEGTVTVTAHEANSDDDVDFNIQVSKAANSSEVYIDPSKTLLFLDINEQTVLTASLVNGTTTENNNLVWSTEDGDGIIKIFGSGTSVSVTGLSSGDCKIKISSSKADSVYINVSVSNTLSDELYLTTSNVSIDMYVGTQRTVTANLSGGSLVAQEGIIWTSSNSSILSIEGSGSTVLFNPLLSGTVQVTVVHPQSANKLTIYVVITQGSGKYISPSDTYVEVYKGYSTTLEATLVNGSDYEQKGLTWEIEDETIATLVGSGDEVQVTGVGIGSTKVLVSHADSTNSEYIYLTVVEAPSEQIYLSSSLRYITVATGSTQSASARLVNGTVLQAEQTTWISSDSSIAKVQGAGSSIQIIGVSAGFVTITATNPNTTADSDISFYCTVKESSASDMVLSTTSSYYDLTLGDSRDVYASLSNASATDLSKITWVSTDQTVLTILGSGDNVGFKAVGEGSATVVISQPDAVNTIYLDIEVTSPNKVLTLNKTGLTINVAAQVTITAAITNSTSSDYSNIVWTLEHDSNLSPPVSILGSGKQVIIKGIAAGECTVRATLSSNGATATIDCQVSEVSSFSLLTNTVKVAPPDYGETAVSSLVSFLIYPLNSNVSISVSDPSIASVERTSSTSTTLAVTGLKEGSTTAYLISNGVQESLTINSSFSRSLTVEETSISGEPDEVYKVGFTVYPSSDSVSATTSNASVCSVSVSKSSTSTSGYIVINPVAAGTATITVKAGSITRTINCTFKWNYSLSLEKTQVSLTPSSTTQTVKFTYYPASATVSYSGATSNFSYFNVSYSDGSGTISYKAAQEQSSTVNIIVGDKSAGLTVIAEYTDITLNFSHSAVNETSGSYQYCSYNSSASILTLGDGNTSTLAFSIGNSGVSVSKVEWITSISSTEISSNSDYSKSFKLDHKTELSDANTTISLGTIRIRITHGPNNKVYEKTITVKGYVLWT